MKAKEDWVFIAFGDRGSKMNIVGISLAHYETHNTNVGFVYGKCYMDDDDTLFDELKDDVESVILDYCLLLPWKDENEIFEHNYAIIFRDWVMTNTIGKKQLPTLCKKLFNIST